MYVTITNPYEKQYIFMPLDDGPYTISSSVHWSHGYTLVLMIKRHGLTILELTLNLHHYLINEWQRNVLAYADEYLNLKQISQSFDLILFLFPWLLVAHHGY